MVKKWVLGSLGLFTLSGAVFAGVSVPFDMAGSWYKGMEIDGLSVKKGDTLAITLPSPSLYISSLWGKASAECSNEVTATTDIATCPVTEVGSYTSLTSFGIDVRDEAGTHAKGALLVSTPGALPYHGTLSLHLSPKPQGAENFDRPDILVIVDGVQVAEVNQADYGKTVNLPISFANPKAQVLIRLKQIPAMMTLATPNAFELSDQETASVSVIYAPPALIESGQVDLIAAVSQGNPPSVKAPFSVTTEDGKVLASGELSFQAPIHLTLPPSVDPATLTIPGFIDHGTFYRPEKGIAQSIQVQSGQTQSWTMRYQPEAILSETVTVMITGLPQGSGSLAHLTLSDGNPQDTQTMDLSNGKRVFSILQNQKNWTITADRVGDFLPTIEPSEFVANQSNQTIQVNYQEKPLSPLFFSPYKDVTVNLNWNTNQLSTKVAGTFEPLVNRLKAEQNPAISLAFATGECGKESFGGVPGTDFAQANIPSLLENKIGYVISTGGAMGSFKCQSSEALQTMIDRYQSPEFLGLDYDIEGGYTQQDLIDLMNTTAVVQKAHPGLRVSLTLATLATPKEKSSTEDQLNILGDWAIQAAKDAGLNFNVNLMVMDFGGTQSCIVGDQGRCDMVKSSERAAQALHDYYQIPYSKIELTPMLGQNDTHDEVTSLDDMKAITDWSNTQGLGAIHYWSFDRDVDGCAVGSVSPICNGTGDAALAFDRAVLGSVSLKYKNQQNLAKLQSLMVDNPVTEMTKE